MLDLNVIKARLDIIEDNIAYLKKIAEISYDTFSSDPDKTRSVRYALQISIEACLDIGQHLLAGLGLGRPANYKDVFSILGKNNILTDEFAQKIIPMAKFRNRLVHLYWEVDNKQIYGILQNHLDDFVEFARQINKFIEEYGKYEF